MALLKPGASFENVTFNASRCQQRVKKPPCALCREAWPIPEEFQGHKYHVQTHGTGMTGESGKRAGSGRADGRVCAFAGRLEFSPQKKRRRKTRMKVSDTKTGPNRFQIEKSLAIEKRSMMFNVCWLKEVLWSAWNVLEGCRSRHRF